MAIDPSLVSLITVPELATEGLTDATLIPHQVVGGELKKATLAVFAAYLAGKFKAIITLDQTKIVDEGGDANWYVEFKDADGDAIPVGFRPYFIETTYGDPDAPGETRTDPIPALMQNKSTWAFPRIYGFPDPATAQTINIYIV